MQRRHLLAGALQLRQKNSADPIQRWPSSYNSATSNEPEGAPAAPGLSLSLDPVAELVHRKAALETLTAQALSRHKRWSPEWSRIALAYGELRGELFACLVLMGQSAHGNVSLTEVSQAVSNVQLASEELLKSIGESDTESGVTGARLALVFEQLRKKRMKRELPAITLEIPLKPLRSVIGRF